MRKYAAGKYYQNHSHSLEGYQSGVTRRESLAPLIWRRIWKPFS